MLYVDDEEPLVVLAKRWLGRLGYAHAMAAPLSSPVIAGYPGALVALAAGVMGEWALPADESLVFSELLVAQLRAEARGLPAADRPLYKLGSLAPTGRLAQKLNPDAISRFVATLDQP